MNTRLILPTSSTRRSLKKNGSFVNKRWGDLQAEDELWIRARIKAMSERTVLDGQQTATLDWALVQHFDVCRRLRRVLEESVYKKLYYFGDEDSPPYFLDALSSQRYWPSNHVASLY